jgi:hypothetical protein
MLLALNPAVVLKNPYVESKFKDLYFRGQSVETRRKIRGTTEWK